MRYGLYYQTWYSGEYFKALNFSTISPRGEGFHMSGTILVSAYTAVKTIYKENKNLLATGV